MIYKSIKLINSDRWLLFLISEHNRIT